MECENCKCSYYLDSSHLFLSCNHHLNKENKNKIIGLYRPSWCPLENETSVKETLSRIK